MYLSADRLEILRERVMLFDDFSNDEILHLLQFAQKRGFSTDDVLVDERDDSGHIHILISGRAGVVRDYPDGPETLAVLEPGATIGEMAMIDEPRRHASSRPAMGLCSISIRPRSSRWAMTFFVSYTKLITILVRRPSCESADGTDGRPRTVGVELDRLRHRPIGEIQMARAKRIGLVGRI